MQSKQSTLTKMVTGLLLISVLSLPVLAVNGTVNADGGLRMRAAGNTDATLLSTIPDGTALEILSTTDNNWHEVSYQDYEGFVYGEYVNLDETAAAAAEEPQPVHVRVTEGPLNIRTSADASSARVGTLSSGAVVEVIYTVNGWYRIADGYISADYAVIMDPDDVVPTSELGQQIADFALTLKGSRYVYGGTSSNGFDCSGLVQYVYAEFGISVNRTASAQMSNGTALSMSELQPGDAVFFLKSGSGASRASHCGIYIGNGQFIHASTPTKGVIVNDMDYAYYTSGFVGGRRMT